MATFKFKLNFYALDIGTFEPIVNLKVYQVVNVESKKLITTSKERGLVSYDFEGTGDVLLSFEHNDYDSRSYSFTFGQLMSTESPVSMLFQKRSSSSSYKIGKESNPTLLDWLGRTIDDTSFYIQYKYGDTLSERILFKKDNSMYYFEYPVDKSLSINKYLKYHLSDGRSGSTRLPVAPLNNLSELTFMTDLQREYSSNMSKVPSMDDLGELLKDDRFI